MNVPRPAASRPSAVAWALVGLAGSIAVFIAFGIMGWPGQPDFCTLPGANCYCEAARTPPSAILGKQPANTWSNLGALAAGLAILAFADRQRARQAGGTSSATNPMAAGRWPAVAYGFLVLGLGLGSMAFHGSLTRLGGWLDTLSMILFITFVIVYDIARINRFDGDRARVLGTFAFLNAPLALLTWEVAGSGTRVFAIGVAVAIALELLLAFRGAGGRKRSAALWLPFALLTFAVATVVWRLSWTGEPLCDPTSLFQGHALWHLLAEGVVPLMLFTHFRTETSSPRPQGEL